ncbi:MAG: hypothetical protein JST67_00730 [Bacteroidetes bacterium]|nr:hypothetical protein [Bacteroidota bacterium]
MNENEDKLPSIEDIAQQIKESEVAPDTDKAETSTQQLIALLSSHDHNHKDAGLELLKNEKSIPFLIDAITQTAEKKQKAVLIAACWESGLDFKGNEAFFTSLALDIDMFVSLEAITVLDTMDIELATAKNITAQISDAALLKHPNKDMLLDFKNNLLEKIQEAGT